MRQLYPEIEPYKTGFLKVSAIHTLYYEESGNPEGNPIVHLHGGPGTPSKPRYRRFFNPEKYRIIIYDQRGVGKSTPSGELKENTTQELVKDLEKLREHLNIDKWIVYGGSWGSTLSLVYAINHPDKVKALILRGIFLITKEESDWILKEGANKFFPDSFEKYIDPIPESERNDVIEAYYKRLTKGTREEQIKLLKTFFYYDQSMMMVNVDEKDLVVEEVTDADIASSKILFHYYKNQGFLPDNYFFENIDKIRNIPAVIIHGRYDMVCPLINAWKLHKAWPEAEFYIIPASGHHSKEPLIADKLIEYTDKFGDL